MPPLFDDTCGLILDGGRATRLGGRHKAFLVVDGETIALRTVRLFGELFARTLVATSRPEAWGDLGVVTVADPVADGGPLAGIVAGLEAADRPLLFVAAGDMPHLSSSLVRHLVRLAHEAAGSAVVPVRGGRPEPLHSVLPTRLAGEARRRLLAGTRKVTDVLASFPVRWVAENELTGIPGADRSFDNLNRPEDLPEA